MRRLALASLLLALPALLHACYTISLPEGATHCQDEVDKTWHAVGSQWRNSACWDCTCSGCCSALRFPGGFSDDCVKVFDPDRCEIIVHKKDDPSVICRVEGYIA